MANGRPPAPCLLSGPVFKSHFFPCTLCLILNATLSLFAVILRQLLKLEFLAQQVELKWLMLNK